MDLLYVPKADWVEPSGIQWRAAVVWVNVLVDALVDHSNQRPHFVEGAFCKSLQRCGVSERESRQERERARPERERERERETFSVADALTNIP